MNIANFYRTADDRDRSHEQRYPRQSQLGIVTRDTIRPIRGPDGAPLADLAVALEQTGGDLGRLEPTDEGLALDAVFLGAPIARPRAFLDFYTFEQHVKTARALRGLDVIPEWYDFPVYYNSNASALYGHGEHVPFPEQEDKLDYELELACVIGRTCRNVPADRADRVIAGYTILNDFSARRWQAQVMKVGLGPARGKDHGSALGPWLVTADAVPDPRDLTMRAYVNGELWSEGNSGTAHYTFAQMIAFASQTRTLFPGDVLGSGTVGTGCGLELGRFLKPGDRVRLEIDTLGVLENKVVHEPTTPYIANEA